MVWVLTVIGMTIVLAVLACGTKVLIEARRERRRERRYGAWARMSARLPHGSRLTSVEPDGHTLVEIGQPQAFSGENARVSRGRR